MDTVGSYLATRLAQIGLKHHFVVPGDYNLALLDKLLLNKSMKQINCANELNCAFAAEGYARINGAAACVVTYSVGAFTAFDGIGGAYAENLPVILICGAPNTNDYGAAHLLHHTLGTHDFSYQIEMAKWFTCEAVAIRRAEDAPGLIDRAIRAALLAKKPAYIELPSNLAGAPCAAPGPISAVIDPVPSDPASLAAAIDTAAAFLAQKLKPMLLAGPKLRAAGAEAAFLELADAMGCSVAVMPSAKSFFPEQHPQFIGVSWGEVSTLGANAIVDWSDGIVCAGTVFTDYSTVGWTAQPAGDRVLTADVDRVSLPGADFSRVQLADFLSGLAKKVARNNTTMVEYKRIRPEPPRAHTLEPKAKLNRGEIVRQIQGLLTANATVLVETGDSWFNGVQLSLPDGARFEIEMQWGHIGWSVPAAFGYALGAPDRRVILMVGDGSFQISAQEVSQMVRHNLPVLLFLINNRGYTIEVEIHDGPYNNIKNWDYAALIEAFNAGEGNGRGYRATNGEELAEAIRKAAANTTGPTLIECVIDRDDCSRELISWGRLVATANARPPRQS
ncbi:MAG: alpha-keto acid decarboxylase family protein [Planctomycetaceae bacterium]|nr:alpha-keto acid decarboxylase family protein [Planctomycetaceae bacterium]MBV8268607.1 alpha-keto acid decarboxylase family protein [Planctomycetaceae bacterium]MBV8317496.1 alpha-keto acid decarboxylase family protein [Planctomycetaceae bacterium]MBV8557198.1 alpha-keto acid decarboxylase family protein [Planctomycetaceae bacterium]